MAGAGWRLQEHGGKCRWFRVCPPRVASVPQPPGRCNSSRGRRSALGRRVSNLSLPLGSEMGLGSWPWPLACNEASNSDRAPPPPNVRCHLSVWPPGPSSHPLSGRKAFRDRYLVPSGRDQPGDPRPESQGQQSSLVQSPSPVAVGTDGSACFLGLPGPGDPLFPWITLRLRQQLT